jgi:D-alanyl-D-alanine carboxypeptidase
MLTGIALGTLIAAASPVTPAPLFHTFTATMEHRIDDLGRRTVASKRTPGLAIGIVEDGRIVYARGFGFANQRDRLPFDPSTQMPIGAVSMQFTAAALLLLEQDGKLKLDDPVTKYVPALTIAKGVTIRELLNNTSGLPDAGTLTDQNGNHERTVKLDDLIAAANGMQPFAPPGTRYRKNPFDYMVAAAIVESVSGIPLSDYLQQHVFIPLVMNQTMLAGDVGILSDHATGYSGSGDAFTRARTWDSSWLFGNAGVITNVYDLAKWDIDLPLLVRVDAEREMFTAANASGPENSGLGWVVDSRGGQPFYWQDGEIPGFRTMNALLPVDHVAVIVFSNADSEHGDTAIPESIANEILDIVLPPARAYVDNAVVARAKEWLQRLAEKNIDRTQLTPAFSAYLSDDFVARADFAALGKPLVFIPISSTSTKDGGTVYEFLVQFPHDEFHYRFGVTRDGKIDEIWLVR